MKKKWLRKKTTNQLIMHREMTMVDLMTAAERGRDRLVKMLIQQIQEIELILKERRENV